MFNIFKRSRKNRKVEQWELDLLLNTIRLLPAGYMLLEVQVTEGLLVRALVGYNDNDRNYVSFSFNPEIVNEAENRKERDYKLGGIKVYDTLTSKQLDYTIYISAGLISGYTIAGGCDFKIDTAKIDVSGFTKSYYGNPDFEILCKTLSAQEIERLNPDDIYEVTLNGEIYYHIYDFEDGGFIGIDTNKVVYKITHDPFAITPTGQTLAEALA